MDHPPDQEITVCLTGDVMTGRGIDQILPHPSDPTLQEGYVKDARDYVDLAIRANGAIDFPVGWDYVWGDARASLTAAQVCIANLETSITTSNRFWTGKRIHYRMHPDNGACLTAAGIDCCVLANNHVMDWDAAGLEETLTTLNGLGILTSGAGLDRRAAAAPAALRLPGDRRVLVFAWGHGSSGIPSDWGARADAPGINLLRDLSIDTARILAAEIRRHRNPDDIVIASLHWGPNWGYQVPETQVAFAHALIDSGAVDLVHGHSSHHPMGIERYRGKPILYGCGDLLNDYEGIAGYESFRPDLALLYQLGFPSNPQEPVRLTMEPWQIRNLRLNRASLQDAEWLAAALTRASAAFGTRIEAGRNGELSA